MYGVSLSFERETAYWIVSFDTTYWWESEDNNGDDVSVDFGLGWNFHDNGSIKLETEYEHESSGDTWFATGPTLFWNFNNTLMGRIEYKFSIDEDIEGVGLTKGDTLRIGLGMVF